ncbi:MAG: hypothetical protein J6584_04425 [Lactobacillus sp.]|uniref:hypothetical protein n=1 Tax=Bombilactobacillus bombi TaxID=1303590 RepID=UPI0035E9BE7A|nr:hypothetical protein [Lactobacillus sp.]
MYYGFQLISNKFFLPEVFVVYLLIALVCGSSFTTISTLGLVFMAIATILKIKLDIVAGAFFGAMISLFSRITNLGQLNLVTALTCLGVNLLIGEQYFLIILPA